ncbi:hypothetical protein ACVH9Z_18090 [Rhodococcus opacus]|uniref:Uncharacterized protein n=1 Tax=Rhodococcus opacus TaxID=37919 RepID=A0AAX3YKB0_RHOOP|nr:hypothetical protein [Rhodococcus opacus]MDJ0413956.1 hypothetical protein [Rhodococcus opacus]UNN03803.1 hypothetical protein MOO23_15880 [Rhodococcus opacus]WLF48691.1 hypothetical protein Q5707_06775 [Rhodococcus opacus]
MTADGGIELVAPTGHRYRTRSSGLLGVGRSDAGGRDRDAGSDHAAAAVRRRARAQNTAARIRAERRRRRAHLDAVRRRSPGAQASGACPADEPSPF